MIGRIFSTFYESCIRNIAGSPGRWLRYRFYRKRFGACGKNVVIDVGVLIKNPGAIFVGDNVWIDDYAILIAGEVKGDHIFRKKVNDYTFKEGEMHIGSGVHVGPYALIQAHAGVAIGEEVGIAAGCKIYSMSGYYRNLHNPEDQNIYSLSAVAPPGRQSSLAAPIVLMRNSAIGLNSVLLPGTVIGENSWVGVNTYVNGKKLRANSIYGVEPAKRIHTLRNPGDENLS